MKRCLTLALILILLILPTAAFADPIPADDSKTLTNGLIPKSLTLTNDDRLNPAETFTFTFTQQDATTNTNLATVDIPDTTISYAAGETGDKTGAISLTNFGSAAVGRYTYTVVETAGDTAGMTYSTRTGTLVVDKETNGTVKPYLIIGAMGENMDLKYTNFDNSFAAGDLTVTKQVTGNLGDQGKYFDVTVTLTAPIGKTVKNGVMELWAADATVGVAYNFGESITFQLKHDESFTIKNLPYGVSYSVVETDPAQGYTVTYDGATGTIGAATQTTTIVNHKSANVPTGLTLDSLPYILLLIGAIAGMVFFVIRRRTSHEE